VKNTSSRRKLDHVWISLIITTPPLPGECSRVLVGVLARIRRRVIAYYSHRAAALSTHSYHYYSAAGRSHYLKERKKTESYPTDGYLPCEYILYRNIYTHTHTLVYYNNIRVRKSAREFNYWFPPSPTPYLGDRLTTPKKRICSEGCG